MTDAAAHSAAPPRRNMLLVTIDTFRADRVGIGLTPAIDRLAASGLRFTAAHSAVPLTLPVAHDDSHRTAAAGARRPRERHRYARRPAHQTVARLLKGAGYDTAAFVGAFVLDHRFGLAQGFDTYDDQIPRDPDATERLEAERPASAVVDRALAWLEARQSAIRNPQSAFFLWIHLYDPHAPYTPPTEFLPAGRAPYDGEIAYADAQLARVLDALRAQGAMDRTMVVVAGDHGEGLGDHGERTHGMLLYESTLRVPLVIADRSRSSSGDDRRTGQPGRDRADDPSRGRRDAAGGHEGTRSDADRLGSAFDVYSETEYPLAAGWSPLQALTDGRWKTIRAGAATEVYDLQRDPREEHDVVGVASRRRRRDGDAQSRRFTRARRRRALERSRPRRRSGCARSATSRARRRPRQARMRPNPSARIATWNEFEDALSALTARRADALATLRRLASANRDAPVIQTTYARALKDGGQTEAGAGGVPRGRETLADRRRSSSRSRRRRAAGGGRGDGRERKGAARRGDTRRSGRAGARTQQCARAQRRSACSPSTKARPTRR